MDERFIKDYSYCRGIGEKKMDELSELEQELYNWLKKVKVLTIPQIREHNPRMTGAMGKLISRHLAELKRDIHEPVKEFRKKLVLIEGEDNGKTL